MFQADEMEKMAALFDRYIKESDQFYSRLAKQQNTAWKKFNDETNG